MSDSITILGLESSCDDTAAAIVCHSAENGTEILSSEVFDQYDLHADFGGVVPEIAARAHAERLDICVENALDKANLRLSDVDAISVTSGPGLIGGVLSGVMCAKGLAVGAGKPLISVNHLAGHALTPRMTDGIVFPYLMLLVSGGHCQFLIVHSVDEYTRLGGTIDDAPGEAFDKTAKLLGLGYPGGPLVQEKAAQGDIKRFKFPRPLLDRAGCDMSFSGLKTALRRARDQIVEEKGGLTVTDQADLCAGFQDAIAAVLTEKTRRACLAFMKQTNTKTPVLAVAGGVAANSQIRAALQDLCAEQAFEFLAPPLKYCTDNAAMIAWVGVEKYRAGEFSDLSLNARPRWPLDQSAAPILGSGKKGAKA